MDEKLPEGWENVKLGDVVFPGITLHPKNLNEQHFMYVDIEALDNNIQKIVAPKKILSKEAPGRARLVIHTNDIIFSLTRPYLKNIAIVPPELDNQIASTAYCVMRPENGISSYFIFYLVIRDDFIKSVVTYGDSPPAAHDDEFLAIEIPLAPLSEQTRIVAAIEQQFTRLDNAVASLQSAKARAKQYRASLLKSAVEGELTKEWRAEHPAQETGAQLLARILTERRKRWEDEQLAKMRESGIVPKDDKWKERYKEPQGPDVEKLRELPEGWCWATLESFAHIQLGKMLSPKAFEKHLIQLPYLRNENIRWGSIDYSDIKNMGFKEEELEKYSVLPGDLLVCEGGEPGRCAIYKENIGYSNKTQRLMYQKALHRVRMIGNIISPYFIQLCLQHYVASRTIIPKFSETTIKHLPLEKISALPFPLPPLAEQAQIVAEVEEKLSNIEQMEATIEKCLRRAEHERQSILREAFAGRLVAQDPHDEPASVLLERIREERKRRVEVEEKRRRESKVEKAQQKKRKKVAPLYDVLVEAGGELTPEELYKRSEDQRKTQPEQEQDEAFYIQLDAEEAASLIAEARPAYNTVVLRALEQDDEEDEENEEAVREQSKHNVEQRKTLWDG
ncbi:MAG TPA: restriction endonuclease subunit S [Ktedonobacteraceae bacterium]|nr:restriction endonuclease subunit S [Ktedonobacteraceae bacterium]